MNSTFFIVHYYLDVFYVQNVWLIFFLSNKIVHCHLITLLKIKQQGIVEVFSYLRRGETITKSSSLKRPEDRTCLRIL